MARRAGDALTEPRIYLDHHATTPCDPRVVEAMRPFWNETFGNPASRLHDFGMEAYEAVEAARATVARCLSCEPAEVLFTSGATESLNTALKGLAAMRPEKRHIVTQATEHKAVLDAAKRLGMRPGNPVVSTILPVDGDGFVDPAAVKAAIRPDTLCVAVMAANNEIGTIQPVREIGEVCRSTGVPFVCDATQAVGKIPFEARWCDMAALSAHKFYGPKGVGVLYLRRETGLRIEPLLDGGGHEGGLRSGTVNVSGVVGLARAVEIACAERVVETNRVRILRDELFARLAEVGHTRLYGPSVESDRRLPGNLMIGFHFIEAESLLLSLDGIALSTGSACTTAKQEPSHVLAAIGCSKDDARGSIRFGIGRSNSRSEIEVVAKRVMAGVRRLRDLSPYAPQG